MYRGSYGSASQTAENPVMIQRQIRNCQKEEDFVVFLPDPKNLLEIHFILRGPNDPDNQEFRRGLYHGRLLLPSNYPFSAPNVQLMTENGRFQTYTNICFSFTAFHPESYSPAVGIAGIILGLQSLFTDYNERSAVGMLSVIDKDKIRRLAEESRNYVCKQCNVCHQQYIKRLLKEE